MTACTDPGSFSALDLPAGSLLKKHLTEARWLSLKDLCTRGGVTLRDCMRSGMGRPDSVIGLYAGDAESFERFGSLFDPLIRDCHRGFPSLRATDSGLGAAEPAFEHPDPQGHHILSTRLRLVRNLEGYHLMPAVTADELLAIEHRVRAVLRSFDSDLAGHYHPVGPSGAEPTGRPGVTGFAGLDRFQLAAGMGRDWPLGRGVFLNAPGFLQVWVNEEDHLRIISMQAGADIGAAYARLQRIHERLAHQLAFQISQRYGYLASCPSNLGTGLRASFHIHLPRTGGSAALADLCASHDIELRSAAGEAGIPNGPVYDISNKRRLGLTGVQCVQELLAGTTAILALERDGTA